MKSLTELWMLIKDLWEVGSRIAKIFDTIIICWPMAILVSALVAPQEVTSLVALIPFFGLLLAFMLKFNPLVFTIISATKYGKKAISKLSLILGTELALGVYFSILPIANDRWLVPLLLLMVLSVVFLWIGEANKFLIFVLVIGIIIVNLIFIFGGRGVVNQKLSPIKTSVEEYFSEDERIAESIKIAQTAPICKCAQDIFITMEAPRWDYHVHKECWSGWINLPTYSEEEWGFWRNTVKYYKSIFYISRDDGKELELVYLIDGKISSGKEVFNDYSYPKQFRVMGQPSSIKIAVAKELKEAKKLSGIPIYHPPATSTPLPTETPTPEPTLSPTPTPEPTQNQMREPTPTQKSRPMREPTLAPTPYYTLNKYGKIIEHKDSIENCLLVKTPTLLHSYATDKYSSVLVLINGRVKSYKNSPTSWWIAIRENPNMDWNPNEKDQNQDDPEIGPYGELIFNENNPLRIFGIFPKKTFYYRLIARNECGMIYGNIGSIDYNSWK